MQRILGAEGGPQDWFSAHRVKNINPYPTAILKSLRKGAFL
jgi:hypothetical protein